MKMKADPAPACGSHGDRRRRRRPRDRQERYLIGRKISPHCIKISNLSTSVTEEALREFFQDCGQPGMIYLNRDKCEAFVNFEDSDSVMNALKLDGATLENTCIKVVNLDWKLSVLISPRSLQDISNLESIVENLNVIHIEYVRRIGHVFFADEESFCEASNLNGEEIKVQRQSAHFLYFVQQDGLSNNDVMKMQQLLKASSGHRINDRVWVLGFQSKVRADNVLKRSPIILGNQSVTLYENLSEIPSTIADAAKVMEGPASEPSGLKMVSKKAQKLVVKEAIKELEKMRRDIMTETSGSVKIKKKQLSSQKNKPETLKIKKKQQSSQKNKPKTLNKIGGKINKKQQSSQKNKPKTLKKIGGKKSKHSL